MADYISREDAIEFVSSLVDTMSVCANKDECIGMKSMKSRAISAIRDVPAADVEAVVHCKDCKFYDESIHYCGLYKVKHPEWFYCYDGTRSE